MKKIALFKVNYIGNEIYLSSESDLYELILGSLRLTPTLEVDDDDYEFIRRNLGNIVEHRKYYSDHQKVFMLEIPDEEEQKVLFASTLDELKAKIENKLDKEAQAKKKREEAAAKRAETKRRKELEKLAELKAKYGDEV